MQIETSNTIVRRKYNRCVRGTNHILLLFETRRIRRLFVLAGHNFGKFHTGQPMARV
jgi:hypothetical protein